MPQKKSSTLADNRTTAATTTAANNPATPRRIDILFGAYLTAIVAAELLGSKTFPLGPFNASVAIFAIPFTYSANDMVTEVFGKPRAQQFFRIGFMMLIGLALFTVLALVLPPSTRFAVTEPAYQEVFGKSLRIILASLAAFFIAERLDIWLFAKIRQKLGVERLWLRNNVSNIVSQFIDTTIFMFFAFYVPGNAGFVWSIILPYWLLKCLMSVIQTPVTYWGVKWLREDPAHGAKL